MNPLPAEILVLARRKTGPIHPRLYGQFLELAGRCINGGLYDPESPRARADGLRADVLEAIGELRPTHIRYPGGCAASYFDWQDLAGPRAQRPRARLFRSLRVPQSTAFGIDEAWQLCRELGAELYYTVNAHTQTPEDAANLVEYLNGTGPTKFADLRRSHGREEPYGVRLFSLGNEIYGNWQAGQKTAGAYTTWCREAIRQMKGVDPGIEITVCGLGRPNPEWDRTVLFGTVGLADRICVHNYFGRPVFSDSMAASRVCDQMIRAMETAIDEAMDTALGVHPRTWRELGAPPAIARRPTIALDEWNVWYRTGHSAEADLDEIFTYTDGLTVASLLHSILRHTRSIDLANISLAVNTMACIRTDRERMVRQTIWHAQKLIYEAHDAGHVLTCLVDGPTFRARHERFFCGIVDPEKAQDETLPSLLHFDDVDALDVLASVSPDGKRARLSVVQKLEDRPIAARLTLRGLTPDNGPVKVSRYTGPGLDAVNSLDQPDAVGTEACVEPWSATREFPPASLTVLEFGCTPG